MKSILLTLLCAAALLAQETTSRVVQLKYIHPDSTNAVLSVLSANMVRYQADGNLRIVALSGPAELVEAMEAAIKKLDVPAPAAKNIELTFHMLLAGPQGDSGTVPPELSGVVQQLRNVFGLKSFRVLETAAIRSREGKPADTNGSMAPVSSKVEASASYHLTVKNVAVSSSDKGANVRLDGLRFTARLPYLVPPANYQFAESGIATDIDVREGQKVVVGKLSIDNASQSIFLVVTAKVVD